MLRLPFRFVTSREWDRLSFELARLNKVRPIADALADRGISLDDILENKTHIHRNPKPKYKAAVGQYETRGE